MESHCFSEMAWEEVICKGVLHLTFQMLCLLLQLRNALLLWCEVRDTGSALEHQGQSDSEGAGEWRIRHPGSFRDSHVEAKNTLWNSYFLNCIIYLFVYLCI